MAHAWMTDARRIRGATDGGPLRGGAPRTVWLALDGLAAGSPAQAAAHRLVSQGRACHLVWDPVTGDIVQLVSALRAACALGSPDQRPERAGHVQTSDVNTEGRICMQIGVLADRDQPFTDGPLTGLTAIMSWLDSWRVPRVWPAGQPSADARSPRSRALWARGGHFGASQVPGCAVGGPGAIDPARLTGGQVHEIRALDDVIAVPALRGLALLREHTPYCGSRGRRAAAARRTWVRGVAP